VESCDSSPLGVDGSGTTVSQGGRREILNGQGRLIGLEIISPRSIVPEAV